MASPIVSNEPIKMYITNPKTGKAHPVGGVLTQEQQNAIDHATELAEDALLKNSSDTQTVNSKTAFNKPVEGVMSSGDELHPIGEKELVNFGKLTEIKTQLENAIKAANDALAKYPDYDKVVDTETDQTIDGKKTFSELPLVSLDPTSENQLVRKGYVDIKASLTQFGRTKLSSDTTSDAEDVAATPKAVKTAKTTADAAKTTADAAKTTADAAMPKSGGTFSGLITCNEGADFQKAPTVISQTSDLSGVDDLSDLVILNKADIERLVKRLADVENYKDELDDYPEIRFMLIGGDVDAETIKTELESTSFIIWEHISIPKTTSARLTRFWGITWQDPDNPNNLLLPDPNEYFFMAVTDPAMVGLQQKAQAPNISAFLPYIKEQGLADPSGALQLNPGAVYSLEYQKIQPQNEPYAWVSATFDASKSDATYINNAALRPSSISVLVLIRI